MSLEHQEFRLPTPEEEEAATQRYYEQMAPLVLSEEELERYRQDKGFMDLTIIMRLQWYEMRGQTPGEPEVMHIRRGRNRTEEERSPLERDMLEVFRAKLNDTLIPPGSK